MKKGNKNKDNLKFQLAEFREKYGALEEQNKVLITDYLSLVSTLGGVVELVEETIKLSKDLKTPQEVMEERVGENKDVNIDLNKWLMGPKKALEARLKLCECQSQIFEGLVFSELTNIFINRDAVARKNSVAFYDFSNTMFYYNNRTAKILEIGVGEPYTSLHQLLGKIRNSRVVLENGEKKRLVSKRKYLFQILKQARELTGFEIQVPYKKNDFRRLYLTTRLVNYVSRKGDIKRKKAFGILMLFDERKRVSREYVEAEQILSRLREEFKSIYETVEKNIF